MSMRAKTTLMIILIVFVTVSASFFSGMYFTNDSLKKTMEQDLAFAIGIADNLVSTKMNLLMADAAAVAARLSAADSDEELARLIVQQFDLYPGISALSVFERDNIIASYSVPAHNHDFTMHYEYMDMVHKGETIISSPFYCSEEGEFVMNVYTPMGSGRILSATMPGLTFSDMFSQHRLWQTGDIFMINERGTFIGAADEEIVLAMKNYVTENAEGLNQADKEISGVIQKILSSDSGVVSYKFNGGEHLCAYSRIDGSVLNWHVAVSVPLAESPQAGAIKGYTYTAALFLAMGILSAFFLSRLTAQPFNKIEVQNRDLEKLNQTIRAQAAAIMEEHERIHLMLDATPLASRLWNRNFELIECNQAAVELFKLKDKQEYRDRYLELSPEYQPDGQKTSDVIKRSITEAFEKGAITFEWTYRMLDGTQIPAENTLVRVSYGDDYVVAAYSRDLREQKKMMADIERRDNLLNIGYRTSFILFDTADDKNIQATLMESMRLLGECVKADNIYIMQNEMAGETLHFTCKYAWSADAVNTGVTIKPGMTFSYSTDPDWENDFSQGRGINGPVKNLTPATQRFLSSFDMKSILVIPVFVQGRFWGSIGFSDCSRERYFGNDEVNILHSACLMMAAAVNRRAQAARIHNAHERIRLLTNATPLGFNLWDRNLKNIETNDTAVKLFGLKDQQEYLENFLHLSPEYQNDGSLSGEKTVEIVNKAFEEGYCQLEWLYQKLDGTPIPAEVTLVRLAYGDDYVVAGYMRDLREQKKMTADIEQRDRLLQTVNQTADILLRSEPNDFPNMLCQCLGIMARAIKADRMYLFENYTENGKLYCTQLYEWSEDVRTFQDTDITTGVFYDEYLPETKKILLRGECVHSLVRDIPASDQAGYRAKDILAVLLVPVFIKDEFWGFVGFDNCHSEELFSENQSSIMRSGSLLIANALLRNEYTLNIHETSAKLETALEAAKQADNAKSDFLASISHEMRTPLNAIIGLSEITLDNSALDIESQSNLEKIYNSGSTLLSIINDLLDISKVQAGKFVILPTQYDVPSLINDTVLQNVLRIGSKPILFNLSIGADMPACLYGDELRVRQIINNLLSNAIKYTDEGKVELGLDYERDGDTVWVSIHVRDTGIGIKPEHIEYLFANYEQFGATSYKQAGGTGLGLAITKSLVEMMDGVITVESEYGKGSIFTARLRQKYVDDKVIGAEAAESLKRFQYSAGKLSRNLKLSRIRLPYAHVLVVDDNTTNLDVARGFMKPYGMQIDCMTGGRQAISAIREGKVKYNAIFMDHMMPEIDGIETTRIIRQEIGTEYAKNIPIIALTANAVVGSEKMFLSSGFQGFISKPIDPERLDEVIRHFVRDREQEELLGEALTGSENNSGREKSSLLENIAIKGIDKNKALERFNGDETVLVDILRSYLDGTRTLLSKLKEYLAVENLVDYAIAVHGIKGSSYSIFAQEAGGAAETLELAAKSGDFSAVKAGQPAFEDLMQTLLDNIDKALGAIDADINTPCGRIRCEARNNSGQTGEYLDFTAPEAKILIVDDNETNLKVLRGLLQPLNMRADTAENGKAALAMIRQKQYDLIFMDYMMPVMDGVEAAGKLRLMEGEYYRTVPVIALTADETAGNEEMFMQAGMNDVMVKPVDMKELCAKIRRWLPGELLHQKAPADIAPPPAATYQPDDLPVIDGIDSLEGVRYSGTKELFISLLGNFYKLIDLKAAKIEKCLADGLIRDVTIEVHALKSTARMIGAKELSEGFYRLEQYGNEENREALERETPLVLKQYRSFKSDLKPFGEAAEQEKEEASGEDLIALLKELGTAMDSFDLDGADYALKQLEKLRMPEECRTHMETLRAYVADVAMKETIELAGVMIEIIEKIT